MASIEDIHDHDPSQPQKQTEAEPAAPVESGAESSPAEVVAPAEASDPEAPAAADAAPPAEPSVPSDPTVPATAEDVEPVPVETASEADGESAVNAEAERAESENADEPVADQPAGDTSAGIESTGEAPAGEPSGAEARTEDEPAGPASTEQEPAGDAPSPAESSNEVEVENGTADETQAEDEAPYNEESGDDTIEAPGDAPTADEILATGEVSNLDVETEDAQLKALLEAVLYVTDEPLPLEQIAAAVELPCERVEPLLNQLVADYSRPERGLTLREVAGGYKMGTKPEHHEAIRKFVKNLKPPLKLSLAALETLAVIAYKQPITSPEIMEIRGVQGAGVLKTLADRKLITTAGRKNVIGKPILYKTTKEFLVQFGLKDLAELPTLKEFEELKRLALSDEPEPELVAAAPASAEPAAAGEAATEVAAEAHAEAPEVHAEREPGAPVSEPEDDRAPANEPPDEDDEDDREPPFTPAPPVEEPPVQPPPVHEPPGDEPPEPAEH